MLVIGQDIKYRVDEGGILFDKEVKSEILDFTSFPLS